MKKMTALFAGMLLAAVFTAPEAAAQQRIDETKAAPADARVSITNIAGSVKVTGWDRSEVSITGTLGEDVERLEFTSEGGRVEIEVVIPKNQSSGWGRRYEYSSDLEVRVPVGASVEAKCVSAGILVQGVQGDLSLDSVSGDVRVAGTSGRVRAGSISGDVELGTVTGSLRAKSVSGRVNVQEVRGTFMVSTVSGDATVSGRDIREGIFKSLSGSIRFDGTLTPDATLELESHSGGIDLALPADISARFDVSTFSGRIENEFGPQAERSSKYGPGWELEFTTGDGKARVYIESFSANVEIRKK